MICCFDTVLLSLHGALDFSIVSRLVWGPPADSGAGAGVVPAQPVLFYIGEISPNTIFSTLSGNITIANSQESAFSCIFYNLTKGLQYYARVRAITALGIGEGSNITTGQTAVDLPKSPIQITNVTSGSDSLGRYLRLSWSPSPDSGGGSALNASLTYLVEASELLGFAVVVASGNTSGLSLKLASSALQRGVVYYLRVWSLNAVGKSVSPSGVKVWLLVGTPSTPTNVSIAVTGPLQLRLSWSAPVELGVGVGASYPVTYLAVIVMTGTVPINVTTSNSWIIIPGVITKGMTINATMYAVNDAESGTSAASQMVSAVALDLSSPPSSARLCAYNSSVLASAGVCSVPTGPLTLRLTWNKPLDTGTGSDVLSAASPVKYYQALISNSSSFSSVLSVQNIPAPPDLINISYSFTGLSRDTTYWCRIRAFTVVGFGLNASTDGQVAVNVSAAPILTLVKSKTVLDNSFQLVLYWNRPTDLGAGYAAGVLVLAYQVLISADPSFPNTSLTFSELHAVIDTPIPTGFVPAQLESVTYTTLKYVSKGSFYLHVSAISSVGISLRSNIASIKITGFPGSPTQVQLTLTGPLQLTLTWQTPSDLGAGPGVPYAQVMYQYYLWDWSSNQSASFPSQVQGTDVVGDWNASTVVFSNLSKGHTYKAAVRAVNLGLQDLSKDGVGFGGGFWQEDTSFGVIVFMPPTVPTAFQLSPWFDLRVQANWAAPAETGVGSSSVANLDENGYELRISDNEQGIYTDVFFVSREETFFTSSVLTLGVLKFARIRSKNIAGSSQWSNLSMAMVINLPGKPSNITTSLAGKDKIGFVALKVMFFAPVDTGLGVYLTTSKLLSFQLRATVTNKSCSQPNLTFIDPAQHYGIQNGLSKVSFMLS